ncbi:pantothenate synthetase [Natranaerovirga pectinivora]|uniref:Pantothenate synthetase n=1 Tax=Natranaerovirga pectinivora TaxID=682400 RepID=A0A4R3MKB9_9FIRM|nr:pantoate--beta-alanine ligase [Natranaerovirga pectinivora]TCT13856.1 pantothenate synthetase [Natranaerovirga pectinivora]
MECINTIKGIREYLKPYMLQDKSIGFVPTMGYLHKGHGSLIEKAAKENDIVVVSIFVNPTQFGPNEDFEKYPRDLEGDLTVAKEAGATVVFAPVASEMYVEDKKTQVVVSDLTDKLCGASRPGHFQGVTTVVTKLFNIVKANKAYFGKKDAQQLAVIQKMVQDLNMDIEIIECPIIREEDGLALSSRNVYLSEEERQEALVLSQGLFSTKERIKQGERDCVQLKNELIELINTKPLSNIDYVNFVDVNTLEDINIIDDKVLIALAVKFGNTRLIDNITVEV